VCYRRHFGTGGKNKYGNKTYFEAEDADPDACIRCHGRVFEMDKVIKIATFKLQFYFNVYKNDLLLLCQAFNNFSLFLLHFILLLIKALKVSFFDE